MDKKFVPVSGRQDSGTYKITHVASGKIYLGSTKDLYHREATHRSLLRLGNHPNRELQQAYNDDPEIIFEFSPHPVEIIRDEEQKLLDELRGTVPIFNTAIDAKNPFKGQVVSAETRMKLSAAGLGRKNTPETIAKMKIASVGRNLGRVLSAEHREKIGEAHRGRKLTSEHKQKVMLAKANVMVSVSIEGVQYCSLSEAARALQINCSTVFRRVHSDSYPDWFTTN